MSSASTRWSELERDIGGLLSRCRTYARLTLPYICPEDGYSSGTQELQYDWQSLGAQGVNNLSNKLMVTMFPPGRAFFKADIPDPQEKQKILSLLQMESPQLDEILAVGEKRATQAFEGVPGARANLLQLLKHLIITGNCAMDLSDDGLLVHGLQNYRVKRDIKQQACEIMVRTPTTFGALTDDVAMHLTPVEPDHQVTMYQWYVRSGKHWTLDTYVDHVKLPKKYSGRYSLAKMPVRVLTWELPSRCDYGIGYVEQLCGDLATLSTLSQAEVDMAIQAAQFRWLVNPSGQTRPEDFEQSPNGAAIPGINGDVAMVSASRASDLQHINISISNRVQSLSRAFLLGSAITRQAERVTAEEIRMQMDELETALGGTYSRLGQELQTVVADWALKLGDVDFGGSQIKPVIVTGLEGLSRSREVDNLRLFVQDVVQLGGLPPEIRARLKEDNVIAGFAAGRGLPSADYVASQDEYQATMDAEQQRQIELQQAAMAQQPPQPQG